LISITPIVAPATARSLVTRCLDDEKLRRFWTTIKAPTIPINIHGNPNDIGNLGDKMKKSRLVKAPMKLKKKENAQASEFFRRICLVISPEAVENNPDITAKRSHMA